MKTSRSFVPPVNPPAAAADDARSTVRIGLRVELPRPANFLRTRTGPADENREVVTIDVATLEKAELQQVAEAIARDFIRNAMARRQKRRGQS